MWRSANVVVGAIARPWPTPTAISGHVKDHGKVKTPRANTASPAPSSTRPSNLSANRPATGATALSANVHGRAETPDISALIPMSFCVCSTKTSRKPVVAYEVTNVMIVATAYPRSR
jgi:hypothetical protein